MDSLYGRFRDRVVQEIREAMEADGAPPSVIEARLAGRFDEVRAWRATAGCRPPTARVGYVSHPPSTAVESVADFCERIKREHDAYLDERYGPPDARASSYRPGDVLVWGS